MNSRRSIFTIAAGRRSKWVVFLIWVIGIFIAAGPAQLPTKFADAENNESTSFLPGDAESTHALTATEDLQGGELAPAVIVYERKTGLTPADFAKIREDVARMTEEALPRRGARRGDRGSRWQGGRRLRGPGARGRPGADRRPGPGRPARGLRRPDDGDPRPACRLLALRRPGLLAGRQGRDRHGLPKGQRRGRHDSRPRRFLARHRLGSGRRAPGQDHGRRRLRRGRHQGLRGHQRHAAAGRGHARDRPSDPHLPLADLPLHPADGGDLCRAPRSLPRLWPLRARA